LRLCERPGVAADAAVRLVEDLHRGRVVAGQLLDVVAANDIALEQYIRRADDVNAFSAGVADQRVADRETVAAEIARNARGVADRHVLERRADDLFAVVSGIGDAHRIVRRLLVGSRRRLLTLDIEGTIGVLGERDTADRRA